MYSMIVSGCLNGMQANMICVEVDISNGLPGVSMIGSLSSEVKEAKERVLVALKNTGFVIPPKKITINLSPVNLRKEGNGLDLAVCVGILHAMEWIPKESVRNTVFFGELGLNGEIKPIYGILPLVREAASKGFTECILPLENLREGSAVPGICVRGAANLEQLVRYLQETKSEKKDEILPLGNCNPKEFLDKRELRNIPDFSDIRGQEGAIRAALIGASGFHNLLMIGPPGAGKSMIAGRISGILPQPTWEECMEISSIHSVAGKLSSANPFIVEPPFQSPHHSISGAAFVGGGNRIRPGIISLAHRGVLFLDELTEFPKGILESMRQPLEEHEIQITRVSGNHRFPCNFMLVCAMNPCKCGYYPDRNRCKCTESELNQYWGKLSGPFMERIDMCVETSRVDIMSLKHNKAQYTSRELQKQVQTARQIQTQRFQGRNCHYNSEMQSTDLERFCILGEKETKIMEMAYANLGLSARTYHKVLKVARTIADLEGEERIREEHLMEALSYRFQRERWIS